MFVPRSFASHSIRHRTLIMALVAVALVFAALTSEQLRHSRADVFRTATISSRNLVGVAALNIDFMIKSIDASLQSAIAALNMPMFETLPEAIRQEMLFDASTQGRFLGPMLVTDESGRVRYRSTGGDGDDAADHEAFGALRDLSPQGLHLSEPFTVPGSGLAITLSRRIDRRDGSFGGIVSMVLYLSYFRDLLAQADLRDGGSMSVMLGDLVIVARVPWHDADIGHDAAQSPAGRVIVASDRGTFEAVAGMDHVRRLFTFERVGSYPLKVAINYPVATIYQNWHLNALLTGSATILVTLALLWLARALHWELDRRAVAEERAREHAGLFETIAANISDVIIRLTLDGVRLYISPSVERLVGLRPSELVGESWTGLVNPDDHWILLDAICRLREEGEEMSAAYRCVHKDGHDVFVDARLRLIYDKQTGSPREIICVARDASWQHSVEAELLRLASTDGLTGIANRRAFDEALDNEWRRAKRVGGPVSLLLIDADTFKLFNDTYGHLDGDAVLRAIAECINSTVSRPGDLGARYGGEEFAVLLPEIWLDGACTVAETIRAAVEARGIAHRTSRAGVVTVSVGVACLSAGFDLEPSVLIEEADAALYAAKHRGRNRVEVAAGAVGVPMAAAD